MKYRICYITLNQTYPLPCIISDHYKSLQKVIKDAKYYIKSKESIEVWIEKFDKELGWTTCKILKERS